MISFKRKGNNLGCLCSQFSTQEAKINLIQEAGYCVTQSNSLLRRHVLCESIYAYKFISTHKALTLANDKQNFNLEKLKIRSENNDALEEVGKGCQKQKTQAIL